MKRQMISSLTIINYKWVWISEVEFIRQNNYIACLVHALEEKFHPMR